jgi:2'-5' RNA ligase
MGRSVRAVAADAVHLTLKFFGDLPEDRIQEASEVITSVVETTPGFELQLRGLGAFPSERRPSVIWVGISGGEACTRLVEKLELALGEAGFPHATRSFQPHVTLARVKARPPARLTEILSERANTAFGGFRVDQIELIASELTSTGPIYSLLGRFRPGLAAT